ncbi:MAG: transposase [Planctomycetaceae bacterium]|nr:transposase [Planctomycetaceae bacterium]
MIRLLDRHWLLTSTTYGTWLPGDVRGFVSPAPVDDGLRLELHNIPGTPFDADMPALVQGARARLKGKPVFFNRQQADLIIRQLRETAEYREWHLLAASIMRNHIHIVVSVPGDPPPQTLLQSFKSYASRALNKQWPRPENDTWWTESGSKRKLPNETAVKLAVRYTYHQHGWLARTAFAPGCAD